MQQPIGPLELIVGVFEEQEVGSHALKEVQHVARQNSFKLDDAAVVIKDQNGEFKHREIQDVSSGKGAVFGAIVGGVLGMLGGPIGAVLGAAAGAATGGVTAGKMDTGFEDDSFKELQEGMKPGSSAVMVLLRQPWTEEIIPILQSHDGEIFRHMLTAEIARKLNEEQNKDS
jgi:uncharacterized membrane protein